jgi:hypothetical protein
LLLFGQKVLTKFFFIHPFVTVSISADKLEGAFDQKEKKRKKEL